MNTFILHFEHPQFGQIRMHSSCSAVDITDDVENEEEREKRKHISDRVPQQLFPIRYATPQYLSQGGCHRYAFA